MLVDAEARRTFLAACSQPLLDKELPATSLFCGVGGGAPPELRVMRQRASSARTAKRFVLQAQVHTGVAVLVLACASVVCRAPSLALVSRGSTQAGASEKPVAPPASARELMLVVKQALAPLCALVLGCMAHRVRRCQTAAKLLLYFGAQTGMTLYMKAVLSGAVVSRELGLIGVPAAFFVTALQQVVTLGLFALAHVGLCGTQWQRSPKRLSAARELLVLCFFSLTFALNIGLNNFSLSLVTISTNLIVRSCLPLAAFVVQVALARCGFVRDERVHAIEISMMLLGVFFAGLAVLAKQNSISVSSDFEHLGLGVACCLVSLLSGALNLVLAGVLGTSLQLNPLDTTCYMSLPTAAFLLLPALFMPHPVCWPGFGDMTDWNVVIKVYELSPGTLCLLLLSGFFSASYNVLQYALVQSLSAEHTAFAGNFNKAATVALSLALGLEQLPEGVWGGLMVVAVLGNIGSFTCYSFMRQRNKMVTTRPPWTGSVGVSSPISCVRV